MKVDQDVGIDDEGGGQVDGATHARPDVVGEKVPHLVAKGQVFGTEQEVQGKFLLRHQQAGGRDLRIGDNGAVAAQMLGR